MACTETRILLCVPMKPLSTAVLSLCGYIKGARDSVHIVGLLLPDVFQISHVFEYSTILPSLPFLLIFPFKLFYSRGFDAQVTGHSIINQSPEVFSVNLHYRSVNIYIMFFT